MLQNRTDSLIKTVSESQENLRNQVTVLNKSLQSALQQRMYQSNDWVLQKARYYLELAQINSNWVNNHQVEVTLLQAADTLLAEVHDPRVLEIRQALAKEIAGIQAMPKLDMAGILSQLDALQTVISDLP